MLQLVAERIMDKTQEYTRYDYDAQRWEDGLGILTIKTIASQLQPQHVLEGCSDPSHVLWAAVAERIDFHNGDSSVQRLITCTLFQEYKRDDGSVDGWCYKVMDESMQPYFYDCPLSFFALVPEVSPDWRGKVRVYWGMRARGWDHV